jgi:hypothetical protein
MDWMYILRLHPKLGPVSPLALFGEGALDSLHH